MSFVHTLVTRAEEALTDLEGEGKADVAQALADLKTEGAKAEEDAAKLLADAKAQGAELIKNESPELQAAITKLLADLESGVLGALTHAG